MASLISCSVRALNTRQLFFFNDTATTEIYTLSLHDALPISLRNSPPIRAPGSCAARADGGASANASGRPRSEEHTSELQSQFHLVCRLLLEKKNKQTCPISLVFNSPPPLMPPVNGSYTCAIP